MEEFWKQLAQWLWGVMIPVVWYFKKRSDEKMDGIENEMKNKADRADVKEKADRVELERQRNNIEKLFEANAETRKDMNGGFERLSSLIHGVQTNIMAELSKKADR